VLAGTCLLAFTHGRTVWAAGPGDEPELTVRITSPLGRTGVTARTRIVAEVHAPRGAEVAARFFVDGELLGVASSGPPYAVEWFDDNPFERRELRVEVADAAHTARDTVILPAYEVTDVAEVTSVLLETGVYDKTGRFMSRLDPSAFVVRENGVQQTLDLVAREAIPVTLAVLVDSSQSMSRRMDFVRLAAGQFAATLKPKERLIVVPFTTTLGAITGPTADRRTVMEAISAIESQGGTAILDGLLAATRLLDGVDGRRAVVLISDGYDEKSTSNADEVLRAAENAHVTVYIVGIGGVAGISLKGERLLRRIAAETGGRAFFPPREVDLSPVAEAVADDAHSRYLLTYTPKNQKKDGSWREVAVSVPEGYRVRTRAGYFAPAPPPIRPSIEFTVADRSQAPLEVTPDEVTIAEDGVAQTVEAFQEAVEPVSIVLALDSSGSMKKSAEAVKAAAREFVDAVRPEDSLALITFADVPMFAHVLATERQWTRDAIDKYEPAGGTALYDALVNSLLHLKSVPGRRAVVVMTDGRDEDNAGTAAGSTHTLDDVLALIKSTGATVFSIGLGARIDRPVLDRVARESGGDTYVAGDAAALGAEYRRVIENLRRRYVVSYTSTNPAHDGTWRVVEIRARTPGVKVASRGGYFAPER
jgi:VWFA-related protein